MFKNVYVVDVLVGDDLSKPGGVLMLVLDGLCNGWVVFMSMYWFVLLPVINFGVVVDDDVGVDVGAGSVDDDFDVVDSFDTVETTTFEVASGKVCASFFIVVFVGNVELGTTDVCVVSVVLIRSISSAPVIVYDVVNFVP